MNILPKEYWLLPGCFFTLGSWTGWAPRPRGTAPTAVVVSMTQDIAIRRFAERDHNIVRWTESAQGGHFMALEAPDFLVGDVRTFFRPLDRGDRIKL